MAINRSTVSLSTPILFSVVDSKALYLLHSKVLCSSPKEVPSFSMFHFSVIGKGEGVSKSRTTCLILVAVINNYQVFVSETNQKICLVCD